MDIAAATPITIARALHAALEAGRHGDDLRPLFTDDATTLEQPNLIRPAGATASLDQMLAASSAGAGLLSEQRYELVGAHEVDDVAVLRVRWTGVVAREIGPFHGGQELVAHIAQFVRTREGRIASIETYDCYEPFGSGLPWPAAG
jgi:ketosteroid isomerase-like protein